MSREGGARGTREICSFARGHGLALMTKVAKVLRCGRESRHDLVDELLFDSLTSATTLVVGPGTFMAKLLWSSACFDTVGHVVHHGRRAHGSVI